MHGFDVEGMIGGRLMAQALMWIGLAFPLIAINVLGLAAEGVILQRQQQTHSHTQDVVDVVFSSGICSIVICVCSFGEVFCPRCGVVDCHWNRDQQVAADTRILSRIDAGVRAGCNY